MLTDVEDISVSQHAVCRTLEREVNSLSIGRYHGYPHPHAPQQLMIYPYNFTRKTLSCSKCDLVTVGPKIYAT